ncbi:MAG: arginine--tRNA ligase [Candidatus Brocadiae bacterium]|nr:arginine--tRNA ligase [Candidatus Brocadiia bacterium]
MDTIRTDVIGALVAAVPGLTAERARELLTAPPDSAMGDFAFPTFAVRDRFDNAPPPAVARQLAAAIRKPASVARIEATGPYVNFFAEPAVLARTVLESARAAGARWGATDLGQGRTVVIDFSSPNIAKPLGIAHLRSTVIGNAIRNLHAFCGWKTIGVNHLGDWGTNFGKLLSAWEKWGSEESLKERGVEFLKDLLVRFTEAERADPAFRQQARDWFRRLESGDPEAKKVWQHFRDISLAEFRRVYSLLGIEFDSWSGESAYVDRMAGAIAELEARGLCSESQGAYVVDLTAHGFKEPFLLRKADDASLYGTRDLAAILYRRRDLGARALVYVVAADQKLHFRQLFKVAELLGVDVEPVHVEFGLMRIVNAEGVREKMATRKGTIVLLHDVLQAAIERVHEIIADREWDAARKSRVAHQVGIGAVIFNDLSRTRTRDIDFNLQQMLDFDPETKAFKGETGPYLQYTHARLSSALRKYGKEPPASVDFTLLTTDEDRAVLRQIGRFPDIIRDATTRYEPSLLSRALIDLCGEVNRFWRNQRILSDDAALTDARILLVQTARRTLRTGLDLLGIEAPEEM